MARSQLLLFRRTVLYPWGTMVCQRADGGLHDENTVTQRIRGSSGVYMRHKRGALTEQRIGERLKLEGETENMGVCTKERDVG